MPNPFDKPKRAAKGKGYAFKPLGMPKRKAGTDTRPTEREPKRVAPRQRMPKELESMFPKRPKPKPKPRPMPMPRGPKGDGPKARPMPMPRGPSKRIQPRPMPLPAGRQNRGFRPRTTPRKKP